LFEAVFMFYDFVYLLVSNDSGLLENLHSVDAAFVVASDFSNLEDFAVAALAKNLAQFKIWKKFNISYLVKQHQ